MNKDRKRWALNSYATWMKGELWNWYIFPAIEFSQWQERKYACTTKHYTYKSAWVVISFLKIKIQIGISYTPKKESVK